MKYKITYQITYPKETGLKDGIDHVDGVLIYETDEKLQKSDPLKIRQKALELHPEFKNREVLDFNTSEFEPI